MKRNVFIVGLSVLILLACSAERGKCADTTIVWQVLSGGKTIVANDDYSLKGTVRQTAIRLKYNATYTLQNGFWPYERSLGPCCIGIRGNVDGSPDELITIADLTYLSNYMFGGGPAPSCPEEGNVDGSQPESIDIADLTYLSNYMFGGGPAPPACP